jgi:hypothetical protein
MCSGDERHVVGANLGCETRANSSELSFASEFSGFPSNVCKSLFVGDVVKNFRLFVRKYDLRHIMHHKSCCIRTITRCVFVDASSRTFLSLESRRIASFSAEFAFVCLNSSAQINEFSYCSVACVRDKLDVRLHKQLQMTTRQTQMRSPAMKDENLAKARRTLSHNPKFVCVMRNEIFDSRHVVLCSLQPLMKCQMKSSARD